MIKCIDGFLASDNVLRICVFLLMVLFVINELMALAIGVVAGLLGSMLGLGGGFIIVPMLTFIYGIDFIKQIVFVSLSSIVLTSLMSTVKYYRLGLLKEDLSAILSIPTVIGALLGSLAIRILRPSIISIIFGILILFALTTLIFRKGSERTSTTLAIGYASKLILILIAIAAGFASNLLGIGGGLIYVPALVSIGGQSIKRAVAISVSLMSYSAIIGITNGYVSNLLMPSIASSTALGVAIGAYLGPNITSRLRSETLKIVFIAIAIYLSLRMILRGLGYYVP